ncbi:MULTISPECIES: helix-turn-helix transcriptional regulator [Lysinibacillus]|uniref:Putative transcriptional regulator n=1 Tax=Lysinibacillus fusiformis TaxID=28031 RepID=A0A1H9I8N9_9BACI|nr:helix-turn-helix transcriptional regulator [Lysinibacillus fusiformis]HAU34746.1 transcriptional regulator [Lysinibacillus sp.]MCG7437236.1 helix-turn-helix transcriptional regulator [Lysinibacillus fusiformis]SCY38982.1 putative transcriptional regulator [Lysinibacillus fusiformis]SEN61594.1 putative transcriptional regulator [Lysinibacillus fusiformis]SEQ70898.1 putative transcriptional regulator [Lysinibacillus fusiformis]
MKNRIRELRKSKKITQEDLSNVVGVSRQSIIAIESGKFNPSLELAYNISKAFNCTIEEVFIFEEEGMT